MPRRRRTSRSTRTRTSAVSVTRRAGRTLATETNKAVVAIKAAPATAQARVKALIDSGRPALKRARAFVNETGHDLSRQTRTLRTDLAHRVSDIGARVEKERRSLGRKVEGAVKTTLASLNIPTRSEINLLTRRVEELSSKIGTLKRR